MFKYPYQAFYSTKMYMLINSGYYGFNGAITITRTSFLGYLQAKKIIYKIYSCDPGENLNYDKLTYFKGVEYIQRAWRRILSQRKEIIKYYFKDQVSRELMEYCWHPSKIIFEID